MIYSVVKQYFTRINSDKQTTFIKKLCKYFLTSTKLKFFLTNVDFIGYVYVSV